ncbi:ABC transporter permease [Salinibacterium sp. ZJ454]|uniref:ABC transporter permease n=1 Tax=Salinibacterium sp. ZJ454 TaxID=2708339 RepID=UPI0014248894|nr:ABC transporter permease [Salinibacterium sp. ZJ454]
MGILDVTTVGSPGRVVSQFIEMLNEDILMPNLVSTANATLIAFVIGSLAGIAAGLALGSMQFPDRVMMPYVSFLNAMPRIAFAPLLIVWFGLTIWAKVWLGASLCVFIMLLNTRSGARGVERDWQMLSHTVEIRRWRFFWKVVIPSSMPAILAGLRLSIVYALLGVIASEMIVAREGLGTLIVRYSSAQPDVSAVFAVLFVVALLASAFTLVVDVAERSLLKWQGDQR